MKKFFIFVGIALIPFLVVMAIMLLSILSPSSFGNLGLAIPYLFIASIPACGITTLIAFANLAHQEKNKAATWLFLLLTLIAVLIPVYLWSRNDSRQSDFKQEESRAIEFVKSQGVVLLKGSVLVTKTSDGTPLRYEIGTLSGIAIVSVDRSTSGSVFHLDCITRRSFTERDTRLGACAQ